MRLAGARVWAYRGFLFSAVIAASLAAVAAVWSFSGEAPPSGKPKTTITVSGSDIVWDLAKVLSDY